MTNRARHSRPPRSRRPRQRLEASPASMIVQLVSPLPRHARSVVPPSTAIRDYPDEARRVRGKRARSEALGNRHFATSARASSWKRTSIKSRCSSSRPKLLRKEMDLVRNELSDASPKLDLDASRIGCCETRPVSWRRARATRGAQRAIYPNDLGYYQQLIGTADTSLAFS